jgi:molybdate transport system substrate-binding protein
MKKVGVLLTLAAGLFGLGAADPKPEILVFGAASLTESLQELGEAFEERTGTKIVFSFGASSDLERQIEAGAPADVFFSADTARMDALEKAGRVRRDDRREFLSNTLAVVVPADSAATVGTARDVASFPALALADPASVPAGIYAKKWLESEGVWNLVAPKVVPALDVRAALAAVASGNVPAGVVYSTDAATSRGVRIALTVVGGAPIAYSVAALPRSKRFDEAKAFVRFLAGDEGLAVFRKRGFRILDANAKN